jgi:hypothetical protein
VRSAYLKVILGKGNINSLPIGARGDKATKLLWTIDDEGANFILEQQTLPGGQPWGSGRGIPSHTNLGNGAYAGGEAWRIGPNKLLVSAASRAYGHNLGRSEQVPEARARFEAAIQFLRDQGLEVEVIPFGER